MSKSDPTTSGHPGSINNASREIPVQAFVDANGLVETMPLARAGQKWIETTEGGVLDAQLERRPWRESVSSTSKSKAITRRFFVQVAA